ncbi:MAG TPA: hypothetical protein VKR28_01855 [Candidatus Binatus sp.]|nr:hypothetical protein [Candidatus Binatus sp.]
MNTGTTIDTSSPTVRDTVEAPRMGDILFGKLKERARLDRLSTPPKPPSRDVILADSIAKLKTVHADPVDRA